MKKSILFQMNFLSYKKQENVFINSSNVNYKICIIVFIVMNYYVNLRLGLFSLLFPKI